MARPKLSDTPDLSTPANLTAGVIDRLVCPPGKPQAFLRDRVVQGLKVRVTPAGAKSFVFELRVNGKPVRTTIGSTAAWSVDEARAEARRLAVGVDQGVDPRAEAKARVAEAATQQALTTPALVAWGEYVADRRSAWGDRHYRDHLSAAAPGGEKSSRGTRGVGLTKPGVLYGLLSRPLRDLDDEVLLAWAQAEVKSRPTVARLGLRLVRAFLTWCAGHPTHRLALPAGDPSRSGQRVRATLGTAKPKDDVLLREQLAPWFAAVQALPNRTVAAYLQTLLLVGCRPGEVRELRWDDINWRWRGLSIRDKVEGSRVIPLTPHVAALLASLPRVSEWVFASTVARDRAISTPNHQLTQVCDAAGVGHVTLHGLRRSFRSLSEWLEMPAGVVAQIMGHKPSATAEKHYTRRPLDLLRMHHERIEAWMLEQAGLPVPVAETPRLKAV